MKIFLCRDVDCWEDSWTYGDWRQYVCRRGDETQCARIASVPYIVAGIALVIAVGSAVLISLSPPQNVAWYRAIPFIAVCGLIAAFVAGTRVFGLFFMVAVGPINKDGRRVLFGDSGKEG